MPAFRFVFYTWLCTVCLYPLAVMTGDVLTRSTTELHLFLPLLAGAVVLGLPGLLLGWITFRWLFGGRLSPALQYTVWSAGILLLIAGTIALLARPGLTLTGEDERFTLPLFAAAAFVLLLRYPYFREIPITEY
ncbi:hypothetical protein [Flaviaesturariibacter amylovorans]|uniref:DUF4293 family protein n=1 Tax=Flaviaesturariibacter amylovorans TaxID=1084520 RepID=A0ABP8GD95_9BACT